MSNCFLLPLILLGLLISTLGGDSSGRLVGVVEGKRGSNNDLHCGKEKLPAIAYVNRTIYPPIFKYDWENNPPHLSFGLLSDVQYADICETQRRHFKLSKGKLEQAIDEMNANRTHLDFVIHLGDLVDHDMDRYLPVLQPILDKVRYPFFQVLGNHDFLGISDESKFKNVYAKLGMPSRYYSMLAGAPGKKYRLVVLDGNDLSQYSTVTGSPERKQADNIFWDLKKKKAKNANKFNGALGGEQMLWMRRQFMDACKLGQRVIVFIHHPMRPKGEPTNLWNDYVVVPVVTSFRCVVAVINGHAHRFLYDYHHVEKKSTTLPGHTVHFVTFGGIVQSPFTSFGFADLYDDNLHVHGLIFGRAIDYHYKLNSNWKGSLLKSSSSGNDNSGGDGDGGHAFGFDHEGMRFEADPGDGTVKGTMKEEEIDFDAVVTSPLVDVYGNNIPSGATIGSGGGGAGSKKALRRPYIISAPVTRSAMGGEGNTKHQPSQYRLGTEDSVDISVIKNGGKDDEHAMEDANANGGGEGNKDDENPAAPHITQKRSVKTRDSPLQEESDPPRDTSTRKTKEADNGGAENGDPAAGAGGVSSLPSSILNTNGMTLGMAIVIFIPILLLGFMMMKWFSNGGAESTTDVIEHRTKSLVKRKSAIFAVVPLVGCLLVILLSQS